MKNPKEQIDKLSSMDIYRQSIKWYNDVYIDKKIAVTEEHKSRELITGKIYTYDYDPKYKDKLSFYDNRPIMFCIGHIETKAGNRNAFGINLSFIPPKYRAAILQKIWKVFNNKIIEKNEEYLADGKKYQKEMPIYYSVCQYILRESGFEFALRSYIYDQMESEPMIINYSDWYRILSFPSQFIKLLSIRAIYIRYKKNLDRNYRIGIKEKPIKLRNAAVNKVKELTKKPRKK
mgnify:CR=1 FL=1